MTHYSKFEGGKQKDGERTNVRYDSVTNPFHYTNHPSGVECIDITQHMNFCLGNAMKYIWRAGLKSDDAVQDLEKAVFYLNKEIERLKKRSTESRIDIINKGIKGGELKVNPMTYYSTYEGKGGDRLKNIDTDENDQMAGYYD